MSEETQVAPETASEETTQETTNDSTDNGKLIAESKKYRKRSQDDRVEIEELKAHIKKTEVAKLKETEDFKTLYESEMSKNESLVANSEKWAKYEEGKRATLIEQHPEEDRESLAKLPLDTLEYVTNKINSTKANAPEVAGNPRKDYKTPPKDWTTLPPDELRDSWDDVVAAAIEKGKAKVKQLKT